MRCPKCGEKVDKKAFFCPHCGASLSRASAYHRPSVWLAVMIVALVAVLCSIGIHLWRNNSGNTPNAEIISTEDANKMLELVDDIQALDKQEADAEDIYAYLSSLDWIESICHEEDGGISCRTEFGVTAVWSDDTDNSYIGGESTVGNEVAEGMEIVEKYAGDGLDIVILCPYASSDDSFILDGYEAAANMAAEASTGSVTVLLDDEVSLEALKHLDKYDMVLFYSHGLLSSIANSAWAIYESDPYTMTGEFADSVAAYIALSSDWFYGRTIINLSTGRIGIGGNFYKHYYEENSMENMFFHFGSCCSMHSSTIADALISRGAVWAEGWSSDVRFDNDFMHIWGMLTCLSLGYTAGESADCVLTSEETQKYAQEDCRFVTVGDESYQISIATDEDSLDNNDGNFADLDSGGLSDCVTLYIPVVESILDKYNHDDLTAEAQQKCRGLLYDLNGDNIAELILKLKGKYRFYYEVWSITNETAECVNKPVLWGRETCVWLSQFEGSNALVYEDLSTGSGAASTITTVYTFEEIPYKESYTLHYENIFGIDMPDEIGDYYYINGSKVSEDEYKEQRSIVTDGVELFVAETQYEGLNLSELLNYLKGNLD